ncbi:hypothetical protein LCGC14_1522350 [marine sediment metagenome]
MAIGNAENLSKEEMEVLLIAAWFHDTGFAHTKEDHEEGSVLIATGFLQLENTNNEFISEVSSYILATKFGASPKTKTHHIIRDADMFPLSKDDYDDFAIKLRTETFSLLMIFLHRRKIINFLFQILKRFILVGLFCKKLI